MLPKLEKAKINRVAMALEAAHVASETTILGYGVYNNIFIFISIYYLFFYLFIYCCVIAQTLRAKMNEEYGDTVPSKPHQVPKGVPLMGSSVKPDVLEEEREGTQYSFALFFLIYRFGPFISLNDMYI